MQLVSRGEPLLLHPQPAREYIQSLSWKINFHFLPEFVVPPCGNNPSQFQYQCCYVPTSSQRALLCRCRSMDQELCLRETKTFGQGAWRVRLEMAQGAPALKLH